MAYSLATTRIDGLREVLVAKSSNRIQNIRVNISCSHAILMELWT